MVFAFIRIHIHLREKTKKHYMCFLSKASDIERTTVLPRTNSVDTDTL
jgi:hypothetical protein